MAKKLREGYKVGGWEKNTYAMYFFGQNIIYALVALNVQSLFSDVGITAASVAAILFVTKLWDAINDPIIGVVIDKIRFKKGRFLPWLRISLPFIAATSLFLFALPNGASLGVKIFWATLGYILWDMSFTLCDVPIYILPTSMTDHVKERSGILSFGRYIAVVGIMLGGIMLPMMQVRLGWFGTAIIFTVISTVFMLPLLFSARERHIVRSEDAVSIKQMVAYVGKNKFLLIFYGAMFLSLVTNFAQTLNLFFARYNLGNQDMASILGLLTIIPIIVVGVFIPAIIRKIDKYYLYFGILAISGVLGIVRYFVGYGNLAIFMVFAALHGLMAGAAGILVFMFTPDCLEYGTYHTGERAEGVAVSVQTFFNKLSGSLSGPIAMLIVAVFGFVSGEGAAQPDSALNGIWLCMTLFPGIGSFLAIFCLRFYKLREKDVQIMSGYNKQEISKEEAERALADKYGPAAIIAKMSISHD